MSYKYSRGPQVIGDLKARDDAERNTVIDFGEDQIEFQTSGSTRLKVDNDGAEITGSLQITSLGNQNEIMIVGANNSLSSSNLLTIDSANDRIGIGTSSPSVKLDMVGEAAGETQIRMAQHNTDSDAPDIRLFKSRGTEASPTAVADQDNLARVNSFAYNGSSYVQAGSFGWSADGTDGDSTFDIRTRVGGTTATRLEVNATGDIDISGKLDVDNDANVSGSLTVTGSIITTNDISFQDNAGTFPTNTAGFFWDLNNDEARIYAKQPSSDAIDFVFKLSDNNGSADRYMFWVDDYRGGSHDRYPLVMHGDNIYMHSTETSEGVPDLSTAKINIPRGTNSATTTVHKGRVELQGDNTSDLYIRFTQNSQNGYIFQDQSDSNALKIESHTHLSFNTNGANERLKIASGGAITFNGAYTFPTSDGGANQILQTDGSGQLTFVDVDDGGSNTPEVLKVGLSSDLTLSGSGTYQTLSLDGVQFDTFTGGAGWNTGSYNFIATEAGYYEIQASFIFDVIQSDITQYQIYLVSSSSASTINSAGIPFLALNQYNNNPAEIDMRTFHLSTIAHFSTNQSASIQVRQVGGTGNQTVIKSGLNQTFMTIRKL